MKIHKLIVEQIVKAISEIFTENRYADKVIEKYLKANKKWGSRDRKFFAESVYEIVRWWRLLWTLSGYQDQDYLNQEKITSDKIEKIWACYFILKGNDIPDWIHFNKKKSELETLKSKLSLAVQQSIPDWLNELGEKLFHNEWPEILTALNQQAAVYLRVNTLKVTKSQLINQLLSEGIETEEVVNSSDALKLKERKNVFITKAFKDGLFEVQDASSQAIAPLVAPRPGERIIDACAGAGGKSLHLAALMKNKGKIIAMDIHQWKLEELRKRATRDGIDIIETKHIDSSKVIKRMHETADRVLLDVPCSGIGVLRRNPDSKWKLSIDEINRLLSLQQDLLKQYSSMVKKGGHLVYATCSLLPIENEQQIQKFLKDTEGHWSLVKEIKFRPDLDGHDGFYGAHLERIS